MQDSSLMNKLSNVLTKRVIKFLKDQAKKESDKYLDFYKEYSHFLKEGVVSDYVHSGSIAELLRFESTAAGPGELVSLDDYISRMVPKQGEDIYYLLAPSRSSALSSAYLEVLQANKIEVLLLHTAIDDYVMQNLTQYGGKQLVSAERAKLAADVGVEKKLSDDDAEALRQWFADNVDSCSEAILSSRLVNSPAIVVDHESATTRKMLQMMDQDSVPELPKQKLEINASHQILVGLHAARHSNPELAKLVAQQVYDNALIEAGLLDDPRTMLPHMNTIMGKALEVATLATDAAQQGGASAREAIAGEPKADDK